MTPLNILWLESLDPDKSWGTLQGVLQDVNLKESPFQNVLQFLLTAALDERKTLQRENKAMAATLKKHGLYSLENIS